MFTVIISPCFPPSSLPPTPPPARWSSFNIFSSGRSRFFNTCVRNLARGHLSGGQDVHAHTEAGAQRHQDRPAQDQLLLLPCFPPRPLRKGETAKTVAIVFVLFRFVPFVFYFLFSLSVDFRFCL